MARQFVNDLQIADNDLLSSLHVDCIFPVFSLLNQKERDNVSMVSQKFLFIVDRLRRRITKYDRLTVEHGPCNSLILVFYNALKRRSHIVYYSGPIVNVIKAVLMRYEIGELTIKGINAAELGENFDQYFLGKFGRNVANPSLVVRDLNVDEDVQIMDQNVVNCIAKFQNLVLPHFEVNTDLIMPAILERLRRNLQGYWEFLASTILTEAAVRESLDSDLECEYVDYEDMGGEHKIGLISNNQQRVRILSSCVFRVYFDKAEEP